MVKEIMDFFFSAAPPTIAAGKRPFIPCSQARAHPLQPLRENALVLKFLSPEPLLRHLRAKASELYGVN